MDPILKELVAIPSVCFDFDNANRIISVVERKLQKYDLHVTRFENNRFPSLVATTQPHKTPKIMLYAHLDVVSAPSELFTLRMENGKYYGRGVLDMKSAAATYLHILDAVQHDLKKYDIGLMFTTDEEGSGDFGTGMLAAKGYLPEACIMPDSGFDTHWGLERFSKGCWFAHIISIGVSAHGSRPWQGDSATIKLIQALDEIVALFKDGQQPDTATINVGLLNGGESINQIPAAAMGSLDIRFADIQHLYRLKRRIAAICDQHGVILKTVRKWNKPAINDIDHPLIQTFLKHVQLQTGISPETFTAYGTSDARFFTGRGIPCVLLSPPGGSAHSNDEWLSAEGYRQYQVILRDYLDEVARIPETAAQNELAGTLTITP